MSTSLVAVAGAWLESRGRALAAADRFIITDAIIAENQIVVLESGTMLVFYDYIYRSTDGGRSFEPVFYFDENDMSPFEQGVAVDNESNVYFGEYGDDYVRFALVENPHRTRQAIRGIKQIF